MPQNQKQGFKTEKRQPTTKRPRGAQPGNTNAVKHGFYSRKFRPQELDDLDLLMMGNLDDEIAMLRVIIRRVFDLTNAEDSTVETWTAGMETLGKACTRMAGMLRTQHLIGRTADDALATLKAALGNVTEELKLNDRL